MPMAVKRLLRTHLKNFALCLMAAALLCVCAAPAMAARDDLWSLTSAEEEYIASKDVLRVALVDQFHPFSSKSERYSTPKGLSVTLLRHFQDKTGIPLSFTTAPSYQDAIRMAEEGEVDLAAVVMNYRFAHSESTLLESQPYVTCQLTIIHNKDTDITGLDMYMLAELDGAPVFADRPLLSVMSFDTYEDCLLAVRTRQADMAVCDIYSGTAFIQQYENRYLKATPINAQATYHFGVSPAEDPALVRLLNRTITSMGGDNISESLLYDSCSIVDDPWDFIYSYPFEIICVVIAVSFLLLLASYTYFRIRSHQETSSQGYTQSYMMLADSFGQAGLSYDYTLDQLSLFGKFSDRLSMPREIPNFSLYLSQDDRAISLSRLEFQQLLKDGMDGRACEAEFQCRVQNGQWHHFRLLYSVISTGESYRRPVQAVGCLISIEDDYQEQEQLRLLGFYDSLTTLCNRAGAESKIEKHRLSGADTSQDLILLIDVDYFKHFNDKQGHACGDDVLWTIAHQLQLIFRSGDVLCRWGGDEFMLYLPGAANHEDMILQRCEKLRDALRQYRYGGKNLPITLSIGGAPVGAKSLEKAVEAADRSLYTVKERGRNGIHIEAAEK